MAVLLIYRLLYPPYPNLPVWRRLAIKLQFIRVYRRQSKRLSFDSRQRQVINVIAMHSPKCGLVPTVMVLAQSLPSTGGLPGVEIFNQAKLDQAVEHPATVEHVVLTYLNEHQPVQRREGNHTVCFRGVEIIIPSWEIHLAADEVGSTKP